MKYVPHLLSGVGLGMVSAAFDWPTLALVGACFVSGALLGTIQGWAA